MRPARTDSVDKGKGERKYIAMPTSSHIHLPKGPSSPQEVLGL